MQKLSHTAPYIAYAVATAGMAVLLLLGSSPGAIVARSYRAYNGRAVPGYTEYTYRDVNLSFSVTLSPFELSGGEKRRLYLVCLSALSLLSQPAPCACRCCYK